MQQEKKYTITHLDKSFSTDIYEPLTDAEVAEFVNWYTRKPTRNAVLEAFDKIAHGSTNQSAIFQYYTRDISLKTRIYMNRWSIHEALQSKDILSYFYGKTLKNTDVYARDWKNNIADSFRLCGAGVASPTSQFPLKTMHLILDTYFPDSVSNPGKYTYYDFSCGWGTRLLGAMTHEVNYLGTDPNYELTEKLRLMASDYAEYAEDFDGFCPQEHSTTDIRTTGSEKFHPDWEGKVDLAFSSPPYFGLEDYSIGEQSYKAGMTLQEWFDSYMYPTLRNIYAYVKHTGYFAINIKDYSKYSVVQPIIDYALSLGFVKDTDHEALVVENIKRYHGKASERTDEQADGVDKDESVIMFYKP